MSPGRRLVLLRHAKSDWPRDVDDIDRPLAERGILDATAAGPLLAGVAAPDVVLCSPAQRTRQTWHLVSQGLTDPPRARIEDVIYGASVTEIVDLVRTVPPGTSHVLVVGHEPTMSQTATALAGPGSAAADLALLQAKYPTCAMAVLDLTDPWGDLTPGSARLDRFVIARG